MAYSCSAWMFVFRCIWSKMTFTEHGEKVNKLINKQMWPAPANTKLSRKIENWVIGIFETSVYLPLKWYIICENITKIDKDIGNLVQQRKPFYRI